ncbi:hypothetical protein GCM10017044_03210 [Kordiimonas sediminis]|uniref:Helix-turn-helix domain-containing protein n=1 Tax=Kordiimonas sediminis TaxID=1735581 RepID=A0A919E4Y2_9PROT|nr:hypothetical protein GCM10017044_03210 [Kordiimonas sediminis]
MNTQSDLYTISETCQRLRLSRATIHRLITSGELKSIKFGSRRFVESSEISNFINTHREAA